VPPHGHYTPLLQLCGLHWTWFRWSMFLRTAEAAASDLHLKFSNMASEYHFIHLLSAQFRCNFKSYMVLLGSPGQPALHCCCSICVPPLASRQATVALLLPRSPLQSHGGFSSQEYELHVCRIGF
jgi:hypothetical protein